MTDVEEIVATAVRYAFALDSKDWDALSAVFTADATAALGSELSGLDAIADRCKQALGRLDSSQHLVGTHQVSVAGDRATHRCYLHAQHVRRGAEGGPHYIVAGRYEDALLRTANGWRITRRELHVMWTEGNSAVISG